MNNRLTKDDIINIDDTMENYDWIKVGALTKVSFATRSEAGRYAANMRWAGHVKDEGSSRLKSAVAKATATMQNLSLLAYRQGDTMPRIKDSEWETDNESVALNVELHGEPMSSTNSLPYGVQISLARLSTQALLAKVHTGNMVGKVVIQAEKELNALGAQVMDEALARAKAKGTVTDEMIAAELSAEKEVAEAKKAFKAMDKKIDTNDPSLPEQIRYAITREVESRDAYKESMKEVAILRSQAKTKGKKEYARLTGLADEAKAKAKGYLDEAEAQAEWRDRNLGRAIPEYGETLAILVRPLEARDAIQKAVATEVFGLLAEHRSVGVGKIDFDLMDASNASASSKASRSAEITRRLDERVAAFPTQMITAINGAKGYKTLRVIVDGDGGGSYNYTDHAINTGMGGTTFEHELIHAISYADTGTRLIEQALYQRRTTGKEADSLKDIPFQTRLLQGRQKSRNSMRDAGGVKKEVYSRAAFRWDQFTDGYMGRVYNRSGERFGLAATETLTVGYQQLVGGRSHLDEGGKIDRDIVNTTVGWLFAGGQ